MSCKEDQYTLNGRTYVIRQLPARLSLQVEIFLAKVLGPSVFGALASFDEFHKSDAVAAAIGILTEKISESDLLKTMQTIFRYVGIQAVTIRICEESDNGDGIDKHFSGRNKELWQVFIKALEVNFKDFFDASLLALKSIQKNLKSQDGVQSQPQTSTSTSGDQSLVNQSSVENSSP